jgi:alkanesulfonate monooxygenase SsuD/methylene tetrahydromethanopterin reductase-like flavin-dependent oxidoreductase (luciferase family)
MKFGIQYFPVRGAKDDPAAYFRESLDLAVEAERLGFSHARIVEHYFHRYGGYTPNPLLFLSALSQLTKSMTLVTGAVLPVFNNPLKLAGEIAMVDAMSNGRLEIGIARAFLPHEFRRFGVSTDESQARFREGIEQLHLLLTQERATHKGQFHSFENVQSLPRPTQKPRPKFYVAATQSPETFEFAGREGHSLMAIPLGAIKPLLEIYRKAWRDAGHPGNGNVMVAFHMLCQETDERAREIAREPFADYFDALNECARDWVDGEASKDYVGYKESMQKIKAVSMESQIESGGAWIGSPATIRQSIKKCLDMIGPIEQASLQVNFGKVPFNDALSSLRLFSREVLPEFRD